MRNCPASAHITLQVPKKLKEIVEGMAQEKQMFLSEFCRKMFVLLIKDKSVLNKIKKDYE